MTRRVFSDPFPKINENYMLIDKQAKRLENSINIIVKNKKTYMIEWISKLDTLSPLKTLTRGYIIATTNNKVIKSVKEIKTNDVIDLKFIDGQKQAKVL